MATLTHRDPPQLDRYPEPRTASTLFGGLTWGFARSSTSAGEQAAEHLPTDEIGA
jgi:hypothetical protein